MQNKTIKSHVSASKGQDHDIAQPTCTHYVPIVNPQHHAVAENLVTTKYPLLNAARKIQRLAT